MDGDNDIIGAEAADEAADEALLAELRLAAEVHDPVPAGVLAAARGSLAWRTIDDDLAALAFDSTIDDGAVLVRGSTFTDEQQLSFETETVTVDVQVTARDGRRRLVAQLVPAGVADIEVRSAASNVQRVTSDEFGRMPAVDVPAGPVSLRIRYAGAPAAVVTDWVTI